MINVIRMFRRPKVAEEGKVRNSHKHTLKIGKLIGPAYLKGCRGFDGFSNTSSRCSSKIAHQVPTIFFALHKDQSNIKSKFQNPKLLICPFAAPTESTETDIRTTHLEQKFDRFCQVTASQITARLTKKEHPLV